MSHCPEAPEENWTRGAWGDLPKVTQPAGGRDPLCTALMGVERECTWAGGQMVGAQMGSHWGMAGF